MKKRGRKSTIKEEEKNLPKKSTKKLSANKSRKLERVIKYKDDMDLNPNAKEDFNSLLEKMVKPRKN